MRFALWLKDKVNELESNCFAPWARLELLHLRILTFVAFYWYLLKRDYYVCKAWLFHSISKCCLALANALKKRKERVNG